MKIKEVSDTQTDITLKNKKIILLGTAHISKNSVEEVVASVMKNKPDNICVEIDEGRYKTITEGQNWEQMNVSKILKEKKGFLLIANLVLSSFQKRMGVDVGVKPGEEMIAAINCAKENNIPFTLADRNIHTTLRRAWAKSGFVGKSKLLTALVGSIFSKEDLSTEDIEKLKERSALTMMMEELSDYLPTVKEVLIDERDKYLATNIFNAKGKQIVAVVGAGHVPGLIKQLELLEADASQAQKIEELNVVPKAKWYKKIGGFVLPALIIAAFCYGWISFGFKGFATLTLSWIFWNALFSGIGALLALGNPLSILTAAVAAPITSLGIPLSSGMVAGLVESVTRKPKVEDLNNLSSDILTVKGVYKNRVTRALLVFFLASLGSVVGTFFATANVAINLFAK